MKVHTLTEFDQDRSSNPDDPMTQLAVTLSLLSQMERTYAIERAVRAPVVDKTQGKRVGRSTLVDPDKLRYAEHLRNEG